eukprot:TRINITY_DN16132_c0_g1_i1.p1 TRINITY_DN16132_c0_g1~~TRINITY_DN16132_c0_g1_i1.p1  ORF type:complete len:587 (+),score=103.35 TRINITY_DN16132_c0_g1_i1:65-1825(+)
MMFGCCSFEKMETPSDDEFIEVYNCQEQGAPVLLGKERWVQSYAETPEKVCPDESQATAKEAETSSSSASQSDTSDAQDSGLDDAAGADDFPNPVCEVDDAMAAELFTGLEPPLKNRRPSEHGLGWEGTLLCTDWTSGADSVWHGPEEEVPPIGGCVDLRPQAHSQWLLPAEVVLFEPSQQDIWPNRSKSKKLSGRNIFLNAPLLQHEVEALQQLREAMDEDEFPAYAGIHALRLLHASKFDIQKARDLMQILLNKRVKYLPISEAEVLQDLAQGFMYWHGRDHRCRPCLVIRVARMGDIAEDKERAVRLVIFVLEYALRYAMVAGRVENWVALLDLQDVLSVVSFLRIGSLAAFGHALGTTLEKVYSGRMAWMKILNMPGSSMLTAVVNAAIPAEKKHKVSFLSGNDVATGALLNFFQPNQLEKNYGGTAPDLLPADTYPFQFFPGAVKTLTPTSGKSLHESCPQGKSLHESCPLSLHVGDLWETSQKAQKCWLPRALSASLTSDAARALSTLSSSQVRPVCDITHWHEVCTQANITKGRSSKLQLQGNSSPTTSRNLLSNLLPLSTGRTQKQSPDIFLRRETAS